RKPVALVVKQRAGEEEVALLLCRSVLDGAVKQGFSLIQILVFDERLRVDQMKSAGLIGKAMQGALHVFSGAHEVAGADQDVQQDRKSTRLNSSHVKISYAVFCLKKKKKRTKIKHNNDNT